ncbi:MAG TPA: DUF547 domain-containing protein [Tepidisphaeraceae bacterium]|nr:DUF547 domain-containing protein [Tepidisphaeraceae bacterium]
MTRLSLVALALLVIGLPGCAAGVAQKFQPAAPISQWSNEDWQHVLTTVVTDDGYAVRWDDLKRNADGSRDALYRYVGQINAVSPDNRSELFPTPDDRLAYWINAYNAVTAYRVLERNLPGNLIAGTAFPIPGAIYLIDQTNVGGRGMTLDAIEKEKIRSTNDPRIHFALNCASYSCPPLRAEPYEGDKLQAQLDDQGRRYLSNPRAAKKVDDQTVALNSIFTDFYKGDFTKDGQELLTVLRRYAGPDSPVQSATKYKGMGYDWSLNRAK